jgi:hypothetical protein
MLLCEDIAEQKLLLES